MQQKYFYQLEIYEKMVAELAQCHELDGFKLYELYLSFKSLKQYHDTQSLKEAWNELVEQSEKNIKYGIEYVQHLEDECSAYVGFASYALGQLKAINVMLGRLIHELN